MVSLSPPLSRWWGWLDVFTPATSLENFQELYLVTHLMGADLNNIIRQQALSDDHVQFLVYQILRGLKVDTNDLIVYLLLLLTNKVPANAFLFIFLLCCLRLQLFFVCICHTLIVCFSLVFQYVHSAGIVHRVSWSHLLSALHFYYIIILLLHHRT